MINKLFKRRPRINLISMSGIIGESKVTRSGINFESIKKKLELAFEDRPNLTILLINSPGGSPVQSEMIYKYIKHLSKKHGVKTISFVSDVAASGGYFIACAGEEIYASISSVIGSIGVISAGFGFVKAIDKLGIERRIYAQGKNKSLLDPFKKEKDSDIELLKSAQRDIHDYFIDIVKTSRKGKIDEADEELFTGAFWSGKKAKDLGLIDDCKGLYEYLQENYGEKYKLNFISQPKTWLQKKFGLVWDDAVAALSSEVRNAIAKSRYKIWY